MMTSDTTDPRAGFRLIMPLRVRYAEADMQGIVFNANYLALADVGVTEYFRALTNARDGKDMGPQFLEIFSGDNWVRHAEIDFRAPAKADDLLDIGLRITGFGRTSYTALCHIIRGDTLLNVIKLTYVWFDPATQKVAPVAEKFIDAVMAYEKIKPARTKR